MKQTPTKKKSGKDFYIKFFVNDFEADLQLMDCNPNAHGVYIKLLCLLFKCTPKGRIKIKSECMDQFSSILLKQNLEQNNKQISKHLKNICLCIAPYFAKHLKFDVPDVEVGLFQLLDNDVIYLEGNYLCQKRMLKDYEISLVRSSAGSAGGLNTQSRRKKNDPPTEVLPEVLLKQNDEQNHKQNPNYNSDYNYNYNLEENKGVSNNTSGGMGVENSGGEGEDLQNEKMYEGNWAYLIPAVFCKHFYFKNNIFGNARDSALKVLSNFYHPPSDLPINEQMENMIDRLMLWADEYNELLDRTEQKDSGGRALKTMQGPDCWPNHFHNWLKSQRGRLAKIPDKRIDYQLNGHSNGKLNSTADIDEKIKNETDPAIRQKLREEKYKIPVKPKKE